jgi:hypothetical protein
MKSLLFVCLLILVNGTNVLVNKLRYVVNNSPKVRNVDV